MRIISTNELPKEYPSQTLIKLSDRHRHKSFARALEATIDQCKKIRDDNETALSDLYDECRKEGYTLGLQLFFSELTEMVCRYETMQEKRMNSFCDIVMASIQSSLKDPAVTNIIVNKIIESYELAGDVEIILPCGSTVPEEFMEYPLSFSQENNITVIHNHEAIRFPGEVLAKEWVEQAQRGISDTEQTIKNIIPDLFSAIGQKLINE